MTPKTKIGLFLKLVSPFISSQFWRLNFKTLQIKRAFRKHQNRSYTEYLQAYYSRARNPYYETIADKWFMLRQRMVEMADVQDGEQVLDLGTGMGFQASAFAMKGYSTLGMDIVPDRVQLARERQGSSNLCWSVADAARLPLRSSSFEVVTVSLMLHDMPRPALGSALAEIQRVARRRVVIAEPCIPRQWLFGSVYRSIVSFFDESLYLDQYLDTNIEPILKELGLHLVKQEYCLQNTLVIYAFDV